MNGRLQIFFACSGIALLLQSWTLYAEETLPSAASPTSFVSLAIYPPEVSLSHAEDFQRVVAVATRADGVTLDVSQLANWQLNGVTEAESEIVFANNQLTASADGDAKLVAQFAGLETSLSVSATGIGQQKPVSFRHDVMPIFLHAGCNAGGCHGSSRGKDGFRLSLFGFDPAGDYYRLTKEYATRRLNLALPDESLFLLKAIGAVPHSGGKRFDIDSKHYHKLLAWIANGAPNDLKDAPVVDSLDIYPPQIAIGAAGQTQQFIAVAHYSDGTTRDVTDLALFQSNNDAFATIDKAGLVTSGQTGEAFVMARFDTHTVGSQALVLPTNSTFKPDNEPSANYIDELVNQKLNTLRIHASPLCTDQEFLRRVTIDIAGRLPTREELDEFTTSDNPEKRSQKIDELLSGPEFPKLWTQKWAELLLIRTLPNRVEYKPMHLYWEWLAKQVEAARPIDEIVHELLTASGSTFDSPTTNFYQIEPSFNKITENVAQSFLGIRIQCAQCHNHPFDRWTMDDYYGFTAFFSQIARKRGEDYREWFVYNRNSGAARHPVDNRVMQPKFLGDAKPEIKKRDRRAIAADWIVSPDNPYFSVSIANRVWAHFFGRGIVEPVDDIRISNPPSNPNLFKQLGQQLVDYDFDIRPLIRDICNSYAYQRTCDINESNQADTINFARAQPRRISAEVLLDCITQVTNSPEKLPGLPPGANAIEVADGRAKHYFLKTFGRSQRETVCACESQTQPTLSQALHLLNGNTIQRKINKGGLVKRWIKEGKNPGEIINEIYLRCLSRPPTAEERKRLLETLPKKKPRSPQALMDIFWAVLNSREFLFNH